MVEVNDLYNSVEAAQICGTPLETDFDNIIYDNIWWHSMEYYYRRLELFHLLYYLLQI